MFPFNQEPKTKDCGYRSMWYCLSKRKLIWQTYAEWLDNFRFFAPVESGINFNDICSVLNYYRLNFKFTQLRPDGLYIIYSGIWLHPEGKKHGHYFVYDHGNILCSTHAEPYKLPFDQVIQRLEAKTIDQAFRCLEVLERT